MLKILLVIVLISANVRPLLFRKCDYKHFIKPGESYEILNPRYPNRYRHNTQCKWRLETSVNYKIEINCNIDLLSSQRCRGDHLEITSSGNTNLDSYQSFCGKGKFNVTSLYNQLTLELKSMLITRGGTFRCEISVIKSPDEPVPPLPDNCKCGVKKQSKIVGGEETLVNEYPMMAGLIEYDGTTYNLICGATIIDVSYAVTAAHCLTGRPLSNLALLVGAHDYITGTETNSSALYLLSALIIHSNYQSNSSANDIALLKTTDPIIFGKDVGAVCLPFKYRSKTFANESVEATGWGTLEYGGPRSPVLMQVSLNVISVAECKNQFPASDISILEICTFTPNKDTCQYDSGGPLFYTNDYNLVYNVGVISNGIACATRNPSINIRVTEYLDWIEENTPQVQYCKK